MSDQRSLRSNRPRRQARQTTPRRQMQITVTEAERDELRRCAAMRGVSVPRLLVESALAADDAPAGVAELELRDLRRRLLAEVNELRRVLATVANNVNQLAKVANTSGDLPGAERHADTFGEVRDVRDRLVAWAERAR